MSPDRVIHLVKGYHDVTPVPEGVLHEGLTDRFAIILDPFGSELEDDFDVELILAVITWMSRAIEHDTFLAEIDNQRTWPSLAAFAEQWPAMPADDIIPPQRIHYKAKGSLVCLEETEYWALCGGPAPYSDSYTLSYYTRSDMSDAFEHACRGACEQIGARIGEVIAGSPTPVRPGLWRRLRSKLFR